MRPLSRAASAILIAVLLAQPTLAAAQPAQSAAPAPATVAPKPALRFDAEAFGRYVEQARAQWGVPGLAVAVVRADQVLLADGYGVRRVGRPEQVDERTLFNIGSVTKSFTAAMIGTLAAEKKLSLADKVEDHLPGLLAGSHAKDITLADLLSHRSGLASANYSIMGDVSRDEMVGRLRHLPEVAPLRTSFVYNNFGYVAAAAVAEKVSGAGWDQLVRERLFKPIGMTGAVTSVEDEMKAPNRASAHGRIAGRTVSIKPTPLRMVGPAGTIGLSIGDAAKWVQLHLNEGRAGDRQVLTQQWVRTMQSPHIPIPFGPQTRAMWPSMHFYAYGLGWFMRDYRGVKLLEHGGNTTGFTAHAAFVPELDFGIVILSNLANTPLPAALMYRAVDMALGDPVRDWSAEMLAARTPEPPKDTGLPAAAQPALPLDRYAGVFRNPLYGEARVTRTGDKLMLYLTDQLTGELSARAPDTFFVTWRDPYFAAVGSGGPFVFEADQAGRVQALRFEIPGEKVIYTRAAEPAPRTR
jgi:CubicO group peptidase (beta-lactamase class C family)